MKGKKETFLKFFLALLDWLLFLIFPKQLILKLCSLENTLFGLCKNKNLTIRLSILEEKKSNFKNDLDPMLWIGRIFRNSSQFSSVNHNFIVRSGTEAGPISGSRSRNSCSPSLYYPKKLQEK